MGTRLMRVDEEFFRRVMEKAKKSGSSGVAETRKIVKNIEQGRKERKIRRELEEWDFKV